MNDLERHDLERSVAIAVRRNNALVSGVPCSAMKTALTPVTAFRKGGPAQLLPQISALHAATDRSQGAHASMKDKELHIKIIRERLFKQWMVRTCSYGAFLFLMLSGLDYLVTPQNFTTFFVYRVFIALLLVAAAFVFKETDSWGIRFHQVLAVFGIAASAGTIELMILQFGGHDSPYATGQILLGICVLGFIPARMSFHAINALVIYGIYVVPILLFDRIEQTTIFVSANGFLIAALISSLVLRFISERSLDSELSLQYDLLQSEQKYRNLFENAVDPIFEVDLDLRFVDVNKKAAELTGFTKEELLRRTVMDMIPPEQVPRSAAEFEKLRRRGAYEKFEGKLRTKDGRWLDIEVNSSAITRGGKVVGSQDFVRVITDRKQRVQERATALTEIDRATEREITARRKAEQEIGG
jgi:PAS domain S-box-containing protein